MERDKELDEFMKELLEDDPDETVSFRGEIQSLCLTTNRHFPWRGSKNGDELEQVVTITLQGHVKIIRTINKGWKRGATPDDYSLEREVQTVTEEKKIYPEDIAKLFRLISRYFAKDHGGCYVCDSAGTWELELTNTEGEVFLYDGFVEEYSKALIKSSRLLRNATGMKYLFGFDLGREK